MTLEPVAIKRSVLGILSDTFRSLRHRNYRLFFFGQLVSLVGTWLQNTALSWLIWSITQSSMALGIMSFLGSVPVLFLSIVAGTVADDYPKRRLLILTQAAAGAQAILLAIAIWTGNATVIVIGVINVLLGVVNAFDLPTRQAFVVEMASKEDVTNAVALNSAVFNTARLLGPALAGYIINVLNQRFTNLDSLSICFLLNGLSYIAVIIGLSMMRFKKEVTRKRTGAASRMQAMKEGVNFLYNIKQLRTLMFLVLVMTLFGWSYTVNLPVVAAEVLKGGSSVYSALLSANGVGALLAALSQAALAGKLPPRKMVFIGIAVFIIALAGLSFVHTKMMAIIMLMFVGWGIITFFITANTTLQRQAPDALRGRIMGIYSLAFSGLFPFGSLLAGYLAHTFGVTVSFRINAVVIALCAIPAFFFVRKLPNLSLSAKEEVKELVASEQEIFEAEQISRG